MLQKLQGELQDKKAAIISAYKAALVTEQRDHEKNAAQIRAFQARHVREKADAERRVRETEQQLAHISRTRSTSCARRWSPWIATTRHSRRSSTRRSPRKRKRRRGSNSAPGRRSGRSREQHGEQAAQAEAECNALDKKLTYQVALAAAQRQLAAVAEGEKDELSSRLEEAKQRLEEAKQLFKHENRRHKIVKLALREQMGRIIELFSAKQTQLDEALNKVGSHAHPCTYRALECSPAPPMRMY